MCDVDVEGSVSVGGAASEYIILLSFGVVLDGTNLASVSRATTGINGSSEGIVAVLVQGDTAAALNVSLHAVEIGGVSQINARQLLVNVSATVPLDAEKAALQKQQDLSAGGGEGSGCPQPGVLAGVLACRTGGRRVVVCAVRGLLPRLGLEVLCLCASARGAPVH
jgi:hypothetical protein